MREGTKRYGLMVTNSNDNALLQYFIYMKYNWIQVDKTVQTWLPQHGESNTRNSHWLDWSGKYYMQIEQMGATGQEHLCVPKVQHVCNCKTEKCKYQTRMQGLQTQVQWSQL